MKKAFILSLSLLGLQLGYTQQITGDPNKLATELKALMMASKNPEAMKAASDFEVSNTQLSDAQKKQIALQIQTLQKKKLKTHPTLSSYVSSINKGIKSKLASGVQMDSLLLVNNYLFETFKNPKDYDSYLSGLTGLFDKQLLTFTNTSYVKTSGGYISFKIVTGNNPNVSSDTSSKLQNEQEKLLNEWDNNQAFEENFNATFDESSTTSISEESFVDDAPPLPEVSGAVITFKNSTITIGNKHDSISISNTTGVYCISRGVIVAKGGKTNWAKVGKPNISVELSDYSIDPKKAEIEAFNTVLTNDEVLEKPVKGLYNYKCVKEKDSLISYPRFISYSSGVNIKNIGEGIKYSGGFSMKGQKVLSTSLDESNSKIEIFKGDKKVITAFSHLFELGKDKITAPLVSTILFLDTDSISHPGVNFEYNKSQRTIKLKNQSSSFNKTPYQDTYHKLEILAEYVFWDLNKTEIDFSMITGRAESPAVFTSADYFNDKEFNNMKGLYKFHPLFIINTYMRETKTKNGEISVTSVAEKYKIDPKTLNNAMVALNRKGFIDLYRDIITMKNKGFHYIKSKEGKKDFDQINILSKEKSKANATLNLESMEMTVRGVEKFFLSEKLNVFILPENKEVKIQKNRDFKFDGKMLTSDMLVFFGKNMRFDYDSFFVDMKTIDSLKLRVKTKEKDAAGKFVIKDLRSQIESASGELFVNKTMNKSAKKNYPEYPIFKSKQGSFIYYDKPHILNGVYAKQVYFEVPPFTIDSLTVFTEPIFDGTFKSNGIFPDIKERVRPNQEDLSLGFDHKIPQNGYPVYNSKGKFHKSFSLSSKGIRGDGELEYLTGRYKSNDFVFYPDSLHAVGQSCEIKEGELNKAEFPDLLSTDFDLYWFPKKDSMLVSNITQPFQLYSKTVAWNGKVLVTPNGLRGEGTIDTRGSETSSLKFQFRRGEFDAREAFFKILSNDPSKPAIEAKNVFLEFDLKKGHALFNPEIAGSASNNFPYLQYESSMEGGNWDLNKKIITFKKNENANINKSYFISTHPLQDSLYFNATDATYEMSKQTLTVNGVPYVYVGDSKIFPDQNQIVIKENADMQELKKAKLLIDSTNKRYQLYDGNIKILSKYRLRGDGKYDYYNIDSSKYTLKFTDFYYRDVNLPRPTAEEIAAQDELIEQEIEEKIEETEEAKKENKKISEKKKVKVRKNKKNTNSSFHMEAIAEVLEKDTFRLAPKIFYRGTAIVRADKPHLMFSGEVKMDLQAYRGLQQWIKYENDGETDNIAIDVTNAKSDDGTQLYTGLFIDNTSLKLYSTFLSFKRYPEDLMVFEAKDNFTFDNKKSIFKIGDLPKINGKKLQGNVFSYFDKKGMVSYTGKLNLLPANKDFNLQASSLGSGLVDSAYYHFNTFIALTMNIPAKALELMGTNLKTVASAYSSPPAFVNRDTMALKLADIYGEKTAQSFAKTMTISAKPLFEYNKKIGTAINLNEVNFKWSNKHTSFHSIGRIAVSNILKKDVNYKINGFCEVKKSPNGDIFSLYLEPAPNMWYYFNFEANRLSIISSDDAFNTAISSKSKGEQSGGKYAFVLGDADEKSLFLKEFNLNYLGIEYQEPEIIQQEEEEDPAKIDVDKLEAPAPEPGEEPEAKPENKKNKKEAEQINNGEPASDPENKEEETEGETGKSKKKKKKGDKKNSGTNTPPEDKKEDPKKEEGGF